MDSMTSLESGRTESDRRRPWKGGAGGTRGVDLAQLGERLPPSAPEAEICLLGSMIWDSRVVGDIVGVLKGAEDFARPAHATLYTQIVELYDTTAGVDIVMLHQRLVDRGLLDAVGGDAYLERIISSVPSASFAADYARLVREKAIVRELIEAAGEILHDAYEANDEPRTLLQSAEQRIFRIAQASDQATASSLRDMMMEVINQLAENDGRHITGVPTGFHELDEMTSGLQPGEMVIVAARPSMGKTAFALNIAENMAMAGHPVAIFSMEMSGQQLVQRMLCARSGVDSHRLRRGMLGKDEHRRLMMACEELREARIEIDDTPGLNLLQVRSKARRLSERYGIKAIVIDYLQLMSLGGRVESRQAEVSEISRGIKAMARELKVPVVCLSQLNRQAEQREGHRPRMSDLRESGSIEQDADVVAMLHREEYYHLHDPSWRDQNPDKCGVAELIIAKQRNGPTGTVEMQWHAETTSFRNLMRSRGASGYAPAPRERGASPGNAAGVEHVGEARGHAPRGGFAPGRGTGPVEDFRDGGGPDFD